MRTHVLRGGLIAAGLGLAARKMTQRMREADLTGRVVLITGSSRGLGWLAVSARVLA
jgi:hypothetical protein